MLHGATTPTPQPDAGNGSRFLGVLESRQDRDKKVAAACAEVAQQLRVPLSEIQVLTTRTSPDYELIRAQWLPAWQR